MKTYCSKCLRTSEIVDMSKCPFCSELGQEEIKEKIIKTISQRVEYPKNTIFLGKVGVHEKY